jgi:hypothetical protein
LLAHAAVVVFVPGCAVASWWQVGVARSGTTLGWAYAVMWPCFALFGLVVWWQVIHDDPDTVGKRGMRRQSKGVGVDETAMFANPIEQA